MDPFLLVPSDGFHASGKETRVCREVVIVQRFKGGALKIGGLLQWFGFLLFPFNTNQKGSIILRNSHKVNLPSKASSRQQPHSVWDPLMVICSTLAADMKPCGSKCLGNQPLEVSRCSLYFPSTSILPRETHHKWVKIVMLTATKRGIWRRLSQVPLQKEKLWTSTSKTY